MEFNSTLNDQQLLGTYSGMFENQKVDKFMDGLKSHHFIGLKSNILCNQKIYNDFNATAAHVKDKVNRTPQIKNSPGRQSLLYAEGEDAAVALTTVDTMAAPDVVGADMTVDSDMGAMAITKTDVVIAPQAHTPSGLTNALTKIPLTA